MKNFWSFKFAYNCQVGVFFKITVLLAYPKKSFFEVFKTRPFLNIFSGWSRKRPATNVAASKVLLPSEGIGCQQPTKVEK